MTWPFPFIARLRAQLGDTADELLAALEEAPVTAFRVNPKKPLSHLPWEVTPVPWTAYGYYLHERPVFAAYPPWHAGALYVQEPSSMFLAQAFAATGLQTPIMALDLCGAPGGKATHLLSLLPENSLLVANEVIRSRVGILAENIIKWGAANTLVTQLDPHVLAQKPYQFDVVVVDAPCSGEGLFRKDPQAIAGWSLPQVSHCAARQSRILEAAMALTTPGGFVIYSTCTFASEENEAHSQRFLSAGWTPVTIAQGTQYGIQPKQWEGQPAGYQMYPHLVRGEGFFISLWQKPGQRPARQWLPSSRAPLPNTLSPWLKTPDQWVAYDRHPEVTLLPAPLAGQMEAMARQLRPYYFGLSAGTWKGKHFQPGHALAMSGEVHPAVPQLPLSLEAARSYLARLPLNASAGKGWGLATYAGLPLGWVKGLGHRLNNYYPQKWRIKNLDKLV